MDPQPGAETFTVRDSCLTVRVRVQPGARKDAIEGVRDGELRIRLRARPVDDAANKALIDLLAATLDIPRNRLQILSGRSSRTKLLLVETDLPAAVRARLNPAGE